MSVGHTIHYRPITMLNSGKSGLTSTFPDRSPGLVITSWHVEDVFGNERINACSTRCVLCLHLVQAFDFTDEREVSSACFSNLNPGPLDLGLFPWSCIVNYPSMTTVWLHHPYLKAACCRFLLTNPEQPMTVYVSTIVMIWDDQL